MDRALDDLSHCSPNVIASDPDLIEEVRRPPPASGELLDLPPPEADGLAA
jgi:hypothetical protein